VDLVALLQDSLGKRGKGRPTPRAAASGDHDGDTPKRKARTGTRSGTTRRSPRPPRLLVAPGLNFISFIAWASPC
jgi:hypothetical protein